MDATVNLAEIFEYNENTPRGTVKRGFIMFKKKSGNQIITYGDKLSIRKISFSRFPFVYKGRTIIRFYDPDNYQANNITKKRIWYVTKEEHNTFCAAIHQQFYNNAFVDNI